MPALSIIRLENKYAYTYDGEVNEITRMLTQCALRDELLAEAITLTALHLNQDKREFCQSVQSDCMSIQKGTLYFSLNEDSSSENPEIKNQ